MGLVGRSTVGLILAMNEWFAQGGGIGKFAVALGPSCCRCGFFSFLFHYSRLSLLASMSHPSPYSYFTSFPLVSSLNYSV